MLNSSTKFTFNTEDSTDYGVLNVTLNNDFYSMSLMGDRKIIEDKIQGRDNPYLYDVDHSPLEFEMTIALEDYATREEINSLVNWLYKPKTYKELYFWEVTNYSPVEYGIIDYYLFVIFYGQPVFHYVGNNSEGYEEYIGYITVKARANAPYGYTELITGNNIVEDLPQNSFTINNSGNLDMILSFDIINIGNVNNNEVRITNDSNNSSFYYESLGFINDEIETISMNGYTKTLTTNFEKNPYALWGTDYLIVKPGENEFTITSTGDIQINYSFRAPKYI